MTTWLSTIGYSAAPQTADGRKENMNGFTAFVVEVLKTPAFYTAMIGLSHAVLFYFFPAFPRDIVAGLDMVIAVVAGVFTGKAVEVKRQAAHVAALQARIVALGG